MPTNQIVQFENNMGNYKLLVRRNTSEDLAIQCRHIHPTIDKALSQVPVFAPQRAV